LQFNLFSKLKKGLSKTRDILTTDISEFFSKDKEITDNLLEELEELLKESGVKKHQYSLRDGFYKTENTQSIQLREFASEVEYVCIIKK
jgi:signal recognition particle GTPase